MKVSWRGVFLAGVIGGSLFLTGCGDEASLDATIVKPADETLTLQFQTTPLTGSAAPRFGPLLFKVKNSSGKPVPGVEIEFFTLEGGRITDENKISLNPAQPDLFRTKTDENGTVILFVVGNVPACKAAVDIKQTHSLRALISTDATTWKVDVTVTQATSCPP